MLLAAAVFLGWAHRALDRMRLTDTAALILLAIMFAGPFLPEIPLGGGARLGIGGFLVPVGVAVYLIVTADQAYEKRRALLAAVVVGAVVYALDALLPAEPGFLGGIDLDPLWAPALVAGAVGYLAGRSRRSAFIAGVLGVVLADVFASLANIFRGIPGAFANLGTGGVFDGVVVAGVFAVLLAELVGESREYVARQRAGGRSDEEEMRHRAAAAHQEGGGGRDGGRDADRDAGRAGGRAGGEGLGGVKGGAGGEGPGGRGGPPGRRPRDRRHPSPVPGGGALTLALAAALVIGATFGGDQLWNDGHAHRPTGADITAYFQMVDEAGALITAMGRRIHVGDEYIDSENRWYRVTRVQGQTAFAQSLGTISLVEEEITPAAVAADPTSQADQAAPGEGPGEDLVRETAGPLSGLLNLFGRGAAGNDGNSILVLHSHNAESYVRSDGEALTEGRGGIHKVGAALTDALENEGFDVTHDEELHLPHDRGAYRRSRRTILRHLGEGPAMVIDVHRDAVPQEFYAHEIKGEGVTRLRMVVGRQNPNRAQNLRLARELKAVADDLYPGLIKGIYFGRGNYNQDLGPRVILFEMGAHTNARESAERSAGFMAEVIKGWFDRYFED